MTWPSAIQYIEAPLNDCNRAFFSKETSLKGLGKYYLGMVLLPIALVCTNLLILTDIVTGISEAALHTYKSGLNNETGKILYKKIIASPLQQLTFGAVVIMAMRITYFVLKGLLNAFFIPTSETMKAILGWGLLIGWPFFYLLGKNAVSLLPNSINHTQIKIFKD